MGCIDLGTCRSVNRSDTCSGSCAVKQREISHVYPLAFPPPSSFLPGFFGLVSTLDLSGGTTFFSCSLSLGKNEPRRSPGKVRPQPPRQSRRRFWRSLPYRTRLHLPWLWWSVQETYNVLAINHHPLEPTTKTKETTTTTSTTPVSIPTPVLPTPALPTTSSQLSSSSLLSSSSSSVASSTTTSASSTLPTSSSTTTTTTSIPRVVNILSVRRTRPYSIWADNDLFQVCSGRSHDLHPHFYNDGGPFRCRGVLQQRPSTRQQRPCGSRGRRCRWWDRGSRTTRLPDHLLYCTSPSLHFLHELTVPPASPQAQG